MPKRKEIDASEDDDEYKVPCVFACHMSACD